MTFFRASGKVNSHLVLRAFVERLAGRAFLQRPVRLAVVGREHPAPGIVDLADQAFCGDPAAEEAVRVPQPRVLARVGLHLLDLAAQEAAIARLVGDVVDVAAGELGDPPRRI